MSTEPNPAERPTPVEPADPIEPASASEPVEPVNTPEPDPDPEPVDFSEPVRADISAGWRWRPLVIGLGLLFWSALCLKDALITYPADIEAYNAVTAFKAENTDWVSTWPAYAEANGLPVNDKLIDERETFDILTQWVMLAICLPIGLYCLFSWYRAGGRYVEADAEGVRDQAGRGGKWSDIAAVNDERWKNKGISRVKFTPGLKDATDEVLLDDWKFDKDATRAIHRRIEAARA